MEWTIAIPRMVWMNEAGFCPMDYGQCKIKISFLLYSTVYPLPFLLAGDIPPISFLTP